MGSSGSSSTTASTVGGCTEQTMRRPSSIAVTPSGRVIFGHVNGVPDLELAHIHQDLLRNPVRNAADREAVHRLIDDPTVVPALPWPTP